MGEGGRRRQNMVSALVPTHNAAQFVTRTLEALAAQTWQQVEVIIGDDCSSDGTLSVVRAWAANHPCATVVRHDSNLGWLRNSNDLLKRAGGEYAFFAFHDDVIEPTFIEELVGALEANPSAVLAYSDLSVAEPGEDPVTVTFPEGGLRKNALTRGSLVGRRPDAWWVPVHGLFRMSAAQEIGGLRPSRAGEHSADWMWLLALSLRGEVIRVPGVLYRKFYMSTSLSKGWSHDERHTSALRRAAAAEVMASDLSAVSKGWLVARITVIPEARWHSKRVLRRLARHMARISRPTESDTPSRR